jgi:uncharacterized protein YwbE
MSLREEDKQDGEITRGRVVYIMTSSSSEFKGTDLEFRRR